MAITHRLLTRGLLVGLVAALAVAAVFLYFRVGGSAPIAQAQGTVDIVQVTPEGEAHFTPALVASRPPGTSTTWTLTTVYHSHPKPDRVDHGLAAKTSTDGGNTWSSPMMVATGDAFRPDLARAADGTVWLVYQRRVEGEGGWNIYAQTTTPDGMNWSGERLVRDAKLNLREPTVTVTNSGRVIVAWRSDFCCPGLVGYTYSDDGGVTWTGPFRLTDP